MRKAVDEFLAAMLQEEMDPKLPEILFVSSIIKCAKLDYKINYEEQIAS